MRGQDNGTTRTTKKQDDEVIGLVIMHFHVAIYIYFAFRFVVLFVGTAFKRI